MLKREQFCEVYVPMARSGASALEIGRRLGFEGTDKKISQKVSQRAGLYRRQLKEMVETEVADKALGEKAAAKMRAEVDEIMPKLRVRNREAATNLRDYLRKLAEKADATTEETDTPSE